MRYVDDEVIDVATLPLTHRQMHSIEQAGYWIYRPVEWPLSTAAQNDSILMVGYPSSWRLEVSVSEHDFQATTQGLIVQSVHAAGFIAHRDPAFGDEVSVSPKMWRPSTLAGAAAVRCSLRGTNLC